VGRNAWACAVSVQTTDPHLSVHSLRARLQAHPEVAHVTIELHHAAGQTDGAPTTSAAPC
jgi:hypothetical protein